MRLSTIVHPTQALFVDPIRIQYLKNAEVDFVDTITGGGFTIKNPNAKSTCGYGSRKVSHLSRAGVDDRRGLEIAAHVHEVPGQPLRRRRKAPSAFLDRLWFRRPVRHNLYLCSKGCSGSLDSI